MDALAITGVGVLFLIITLMKGIKTVPQGSKFVIQRLGKYSKTLWTPSKFGELMAQLSVIGLPISEKHILKMMRRQPF